MKIKNMLIILSVVLIVLSASVFAIPRSTHGILYAESIKAIDELVSFNSKLDIGGKLTGLLTPGGGSDKKAVLGLQGNLLSNCHLRPECQVSYSGCNILDSNTLFDGDLSVTSLSSRNTCDDIDGASPMVVSVNVDPFHADSDVVVGWVSSKISPVNFEVKLHLLVKDCTPGDGLCDLTCDPKTGCNYEPGNDRGSEEGSFEGSSSGLENDFQDLGWIKVYGSKEDFSEDSFAIKLTKDQIAEIGKEFGYNVLEHGKNLFISGVRLSSYKFDHEVQIFPLTELFLLSGAEHAYANTYANTYGDTFYGDVNIQGKLGSTQKLSANSLEVTTDLDLNSLNVGNVFIDGDLTAVELCSYNICLEPFIWKTDGTEDKPSSKVYYMDRVGINTAAQADHSLTVKGDVKFSKLETGAPGEILVADNGDFVIKSNQRGDFIMQLGSASDIPVCRDGVQAGDEECEIDPNSGNSIFFNGETCGDYGFSLGQLRCSQFCEIDTSNCRNPTPMIVPIFGDVENGQLGVMSSAIGDINNDGFDDFIVTADRVETTGNHVGVDGKVYLFLGGNGFSEDSLTVANADASFYANDDVTVGNWINSINGVGDVNNDGFDDFVIGLPSYTKFTCNNGYETGAAYLFFGKSNIDWGLNTNLIDTADVVFAGSSCGRAGSRVMPLGDVNGDNLMDFGISEPRWSSTSPLIEGRTSIFFGKSNWAKDYSLGSDEDTYFYISDDSYLTGLVNNNYGIGNSFNTIGDINSDGINDLAFTASETTLGWGTGVSVGVVYILLGKNNWPASSNLANAADYSFVSSDRAALGASIIPLGDFDGDEKPDFAIGAPGDETNGGIGEDFFHASGKIYVLSSAFMDTWGSYKPIDGISSTSFLGSNHNVPIPWVDSLGHLMSPLGDINKDGFNDFLVGANWNSFFGKHSGLTYIVYGGRDYAPVQKIEDLNIPSFYGLKTMDYSAQSVSGLGDVNGDGELDFITTSPLNSNNLNDAGTAYLIMKKPDFDLGAKKISLDLEYCGNNILEKYESCEPSRGVLPCATFGFSSSNDAACNVDTCLFDTSVCGTVDKDLKITNDIGWGAKNFGEDVQSLGDIDGDGKSDYVVAPTSGKRYIFFGESLDSANELLLSSADLVIQGLYSGSETVKGIGDVNNDGKDDFAIGNGHYGNVYIVFGKSRSAFPSSSNFMDFADVALTGSSSDKTGSELAGVGDVNNDGFDDFVIGSPEFEVSNYNRGKIQLILGRSSWNNIDLSSVSSVAFQLSGDFGLNEKLGEVIVGVGDVNNDGFDDFAVGSPKAKGSSGSDYLNVGRIRLIFGKSDFSSTPAVKLYHVQITNANDDDWNQAGLGKSIVGAGDLNSDGVDDFAFLGGSDNHNRIYVVYGSSSLNSDDVRIDTQMTPTFYEFGYNLYEGSLASGDFNGDGKSDLVVGVSEKENYVPAVGKAYIFFGSNDQFGSNLDMDKVSDSSVIGAVQEGSFAEIVTNLGDVNNDGSDDLGFSVQHSNFVDVTSGSDFYAGQVSILLGGSHIKGMRNYPIN
jgi:hypothetical protein